MATNFEIKEQQAAARRERIATALLANAVSFDVLHVETTSPRVIAGAIRWADALIAALDKEA